MDRELKETLLKVADYNELEKQMAVRSGYVSCTIMFMVCAAAIVIQITMTGDLSLIIGETVILVSGAGVYIFSSINNGTLIKSTPKKDFIVSAICTGIFSILFCLILSKTMALSQAVVISVCFFIAFSAVSYVLLRSIFQLSKKKANKLKVK